MSSSEDGAGSTNGRREQHKARTRRAIEEAALELFGSQGFERTTAEQIAERADVSLRTFFRYFHGKEQVLYGYRSDNAQRFRRAIAAQPGALAPLDAARAAYDDFAAALPRDADDRADQQLTMLSIIDRSPSLRGHSGFLLNEWEDAIAEGLRARADVPDGQLDPDLAATIVTGVLKWAARRWLADPDADYHAIAAEGLRRVDEAAGPIDT